jgi:hypothetical protein
LERLIVINPAVSERRRGGQDGARAPRLAAFPGPEEAWPVKLAASAVFPRHGTAPVAAQGSGSCPADRRAGAGSQHARQLRPDLRLALRPRRSRHVLAWTMNEMP